MDEFNQIRNYISKFLTFTEEEWHLHQSMLTRRFLKKGEFLLKADEVCNHVTFINKGLFRTYMIIDGEEITSNFAFEGNYVTEYVSFVTRQPTREFIIAMEDSEILQLRHEDMQETYRRAHVWERFGRLIAEYILTFVSSRNKSLLLNTPEERYLLLIKERPKVIERVPQHYIASYLGIQPESLSRIRKRMAEVKKV